MRKYTEEQRKEAFKLVENPNTHPGDLEILKDYRDYLMFNSNTPEGKPVIECSFKDMHAAYGAWSLPGLMKATRRAIDEAGKENFMVNMYSDQEIAAEPELKDVKLFWFPASDKGNSASDKPFILAISGGAYTSICNLSEGFLVADSFNKLGYNVFVMNYRVNLQDVASDSVRPLFPKPLDDTAAALKYIFSHMDVYGIRNKAYVVTGYSAGASLTVQWGALHHGYAHYGLPAPKAMFPVYPVIDNALSYGGSYDWFNRIMFGASYHEEDLTAYALENFLTETYPPCYIVHSLNDNVVPVYNSVLLSECLTKLGVANMLEIPKTAGHGFGDGTASDAEGWPERAIQFLESL